MNDDGRRFAQAKHYELSKRTPKGVRTSTGLRYQQDRRRTTDSEGNAQGNGTNGIEEGNGHHKDRARTTATKDTKQSIVAADMGGGWLGRGFSRVTCGLRALSVGLGLA